MSSSVPAQLIYFVPPPDGSAPFTRINVDPSSGQSPRNWVPETHTVEINNIRGKEHEFTLDKAGYQYYKRFAKHQAFTNDEDIKNEYYPESAELIKELTGASKVVLFDHTIRRRRPGQSSDDESKRQPVSQVHVDQTPAAAVNRVHRHLPAEEAEVYVKKRFQIINLWRPITHPAVDYPLALCDYTSVNQETDLVPVKLIFPDREGETFGVKFNPNHKWNYLKEMTQDELVLIKCYDSAKIKDLAVFTPHTGFLDKSAPKDAPLRESIELRALVFYD
ncbi:hypothetical protein SERLA73DRAFT_183726 [Serpula lacrymans var. lacrymans S7.3]|uniref:7alpha-cephem-methoxylase P8 chain n=2 Tax=Serpula lacrymans var. lacrymans TaxID=341189 RepID=F8Q3N3_SERL3|nr:uncharacterized protein SERLADRAFT_471078 [Serpula lacrymans var. lacrymans S7.9]EGN97118.1 hypothetical protein SERLA73DRAFT_183726 [Serpula lacrymans var. lacrymans S7.3]EGO22727.1 hypothetical protein SERLADRAFT_471078 [Serpula lacrymans var. lacrymans S7.9]